MVNFKSKGNWSKTFDFLKKASNLSNESKEILRKAAEKGVDALKNNTPVYTGLASSLWGYNIEYGNGYSIITWTNEDIESGLNVAILIQYGHGTRGGSYVQGKDIINPAIRPIFDNFVETLWKEVLK